MKFLKMTLLLPLLLSLAHAQYVPPTADAQVKISTCHKLDEDYVVPAAGKYGISTTGTSGTGATVAVLSGVAGHLGQMNMRTGSTATGTATQVGNANYQPIRFDTVNAEFEIVGKIPTLSDGTNTFAIGLGMADLDAAVPVTVQAALSGVWLRYTHGTNSGKWQAGTANGGPVTVTIEDTGITADTNYHRYTISVTNGVARFAIDGVQTNEISTTVPTTNAVNLHWRINKSVGTTERNFHVDGWSLRWCYITPR